jgi:hypothetical protein
MGRLPRLNLQPAANFGDFGGLWGLRGGGALARAASIDVATPAPPKVRPIRCTVPGSSPKRLATQVNVALLRWVDFAAAERRAESSIWLSDATMIGGFGLSAIAVPTRPESATERSPTPASSLLCA